MVREELRRTALRLRAQGLSCREAARRTGPGISKSSVQRFAPGGGHAPLPRCKTCGARVRMPCLLCSLEGEPQARPAKGIAGEAA
jgi:hypothetical protein